jgi:hypothetical protein
MLLAWPAGRLQRFGVVKRIVQKRLVDVYIQSLKISYRG